MMPDPCRTAAQVSEDGKPFAAPGDKQIYIHHIMFSARFQPEPELFGLCILAQPAPGMIGRKRRLCYAKP